MNAGMAERTGAGGEDRGRWDYTCDLRIKLVRECGHRARQLGARRQHGAGIEIKGEAQKAQRGTMYIAVMGIWNGARVH